jgi:Novel STAND NTPase 1
MTNATDSGHTTLLDRSPYLGLRPFEADDAPLFFGRSREVDLLAANLRTARTSLVYGESGVGKSSLLRAGLAPKLDRGGPRSSADDLKERESFAAVVYAMSREDPIPGLTERIRSAGVGPAAPVNGAALLDTIEAAVLRVDRLLIVLDQFEEYLAYADGVGHDPFADEFVRAVTRSELPVHFMIAIREDSISRLDRFGIRARDLMANLFRLDPLSVDAAHEAVVGPVEAYNELNGTKYEVSPEFEQAVIQATKLGRLDLGFGGRGGIEQGPQSDGGAIEVAYLQLALQHVWAAEREDKSNVMRLETFERLGGVAGIVRRHLDGIMDEFSEREQRIASEAFRYLVTPSGMKVPYSAWDLSEMTHSTADRIERVLERLASERMRILRPLPPSPRGDRRYEIYHDRLGDPILDWRVRSQTGGARARSFRFVSGTMAALALGALVVAIAAGAAPAALAALGTTGALYGSIAASTRASREMVRVMDAYVALLARLMGAGRRKPKAG